MHQNNNFTRKINLQLEDKRFIVRTLGSLNEVDQLFEFRKKIFKDIGYISGDRELSDLDLLADHLAVIDKDSNEFIASYVLISSRFSREFSSDKRWIFEDFREEHNGILELSWLSVDPSYCHQNILLSYLFKALAHYSVASGEGYYFGSVSIPTNDLDKVSQIAFYLGRKGYTSDKFDIKPRKFIRLPLVTDENYWGDDRVASLIPKLLFLYLRLGGVACKKPAVLSHVNRTDFFIFNQTSRVNDIYLKDIK
uniref:Hemolysin n=1 Tax=Candidatus Kentrum eta TaxID=2126337 RepID=A0A450VBN1_9GAMM|nr:MAG: Putative hemolysin [Candidatus Kentron sp. H]VFK02177.1 MAG: Putative hemolysin [Candidatus Kentron sp. H]VFK04618.1 MAG: Putative hemolysin [Candidatus Kentron sp. H]